MPVTASQVADSLYTQRKLELDRQLNEADQRARQFPLGPSTAKVTAFYRANPTVNGPLIESYTSSGNWPASLLEDPPTPVDRAPEYARLRREADADGQALYSFFP